MRATTIRRTFVLTAALLALAACNSKGGSTDVSKDQGLGKADAPVTVLEYASVTCPHCAAWETEVFPAFKQKYIDTGKVHYVLRETLIHGPLDAAGFLLADCAGKKSTDDYFKVVQAIMRGQSYYATNEFDEAKYRETLLNIAQQVGLSEDQFKACENDQAALKALNDRTTAEAQQFNVDSTPTFVINNKKLENDHPPTMVELSAAIDPLLKK
jgi:protein-disulfide isomerase